MLTYTTIGPTPGGRYLVAYPTPGLSVPTVAADCATLDQAETEVRRLNLLQRSRELVVQADRTARGLCGVYHLNEAQ